MSEEIKELLASYVLGDLTSEEVAKVKKLLATNPELKEEVESLKQILALFPLSLPEVDLPEDLGDRILQAASEHRKNLLWLKIKKKKRPFTILVGTLAMGAITILGLFNYRLQQKLATTQEKLSDYETTIAILRQPSNRLLSLQGTELSPRASGSLMVNPNSATIILTLENLTTLSQDKIYRIWGIQNEQKIYCGEFNTDPQGKVLLQLPLDADMLDSVGVIITVEPLQKFSVPKGETVMIGTI